MSHGDYIVTTVHDITKTCYKALRDGALLDHQDDEIAEALRGLEAGGIEKHRGPNDGKRTVEDLIEALDRFHSGFSGPLPDMADALRSLVLDEIERQGQYVVSANGGNRMRLYARTGKVGKAVLARRESLKAYRLERIAQANHQTTKEKPWTS